MSVPSFNRSFAKTPSATTITTKWDGSYPGFNRSFAKTPSATFIRLLCITIAIRQVSIARSRKLLLQLAFITTAICSLGSFNRSFAKTPSATRYSADCNLCTRWFQSLVRENSFCNTSSASRSSPYLRVSIARSRKPLLQPSSVIACLLSALLVSIARSRKLLLQPAAIAGCNRLDAGFNRSFAKTPSATTVSHRIHQAIAESFNRSFAKTPSATTGRPHMARLVGRVSIARSRKLLLQRQAA